MRIRSVTLENIKSYASPGTRVPLGDGLTAIVGPNGAGKSTILEAIGFALFGKLDYSQRDFLRRGERRGCVTVEMESRLDGRVYEVTRRIGGQPNCEVYDPDVGATLEAGVEAVEAFICEHLRLPATTNLKSLFQDSVGPPQGTFTAPFLDETAFRKTKFDRLLGVEEYAQAAQKLAAPESVLKQRLAAAEATRAARQHEVARLPEARQTASALEKRAALLHSEVVEVERQLGSRRTERDAWQARRQERDQQTESVRAAESAAQLVAQEHGAALDRLREAEQARQEVEASEAGERAYLAAEHELARQRDRQQKRDRLERELGEARIAVKTAEGQLELVERDLEQSQRARERRAELELLIPGQEAAEREVEAATRRSEDRKRADVELPAAVSALDKAAAGAAEVEALVQRAIAAAETAAGLSELEAELQELRGELQTLRGQEVQHQQAERAIGELTEQEQAERAELERVVRELERVEVARPHAEALPARREAYDAALGILKSADTALIRTRETRLQVEGGLCPFLKEACLNVGAKNGSWTLETYFDKQIEAETELLASAKRSYDKANREYQWSEQAAQHLARAAAYERERGTIESRLARLAGELAAARETRDRLGNLEERSAVLQAREGALQPRLEAARRADAEARALPERQSRLLEARKTLAELQQSEVDLRRRLSELADVGAELEAARIALAEVGDPRGEYRALEHLAVAVARHEDSRKAAIEKLGAAREAEQRTEAALEPFADLEAALGSAEQARQTHLADHEKMLRFGPLSAELADRATLAEQASNRLREVEQELAAARTELGHRAAAYDEASHQKAEAEVNRLTGEQARLAAEAGAADDRLADIEQEVKRLEAAAREAQSLTREAAALRGAVELCELLRMAIRRAQPAITSQIVERISETASAFNADVLGDQSVRLEWTPDYEVVTTVRGEQKSFKQLSGGEQMVAALAVRLGLLRDVSELDLAFLDEPTTNMDEIRRANLAIQLQNLTTFDQMVVISHDDAFDGLYGSVIRLSNENGISVVQGAMMGRDGQP